jgi:hypothetical protein
VEPAVARTPAPAPVPVGTAPIPPAPTPVTAEAPPAGSAPDTATWKALSRGAKQKSTGAHRRARPRAADGAGDDAKEKAAAPEARKADPFAD